MASSSKIWKGYADTQDGQLHYRASGDRSTIKKTEPLILLHQHPSSSAMWTEVLPRFAAEGYLALAFDMPGFGESFELESEPDDLKFFAEVTFAALDFLTTDLHDKMNVDFHRVHILGHHFGAGVAAQMAIDQPDRVAKLVLWGPPLLPEFFREEYLKEGPPNYEEDEPSVVLDFWKKRPLWWTTGSGMPGRLRAQHLADMLRMGTKKHWSHAAVARTDVHDLMKRLEQPVLSIAGDNEILLEATKEAAGIVKNVQLHVMPKVGMDVPDEAPDDFVTIVTNFLNDKPLT